MLGNKNLFLTSLILVFVIFLSEISIVFDLAGGMFIFELLLLLFFMLLAGILMLGLYLEAGWAWPGMTIFFSLNLMNGLFLMVKGIPMKELSLLGIVSILGFIVSATRRKVKIEEHKVVQETEETEKKKSPSKKTSKKKSSKKSSKKKSKKK